MKYRSLSAVLISIVILFSLFSCMKRGPVKIYDDSRVESAEAARISFPSDIEIESVDGRSIRSVADYILSTIEEIQVAPGEHEIVVRYNAIWAYHKRKTEEIKSKDITLKFNAKRGGRYKLTHPELADMTEAKNFAENPNIWIEKIEKYSESENERIKVSRPVGTGESMDYKEAEEPLPVMEKDTALREEWDRLSGEEKEEFRRWLEWNSMSSEEKEKFREWSNKSDKE